MQTHSENYRIPASQGNSERLQESNVPTPSVLYKYCAFDEWTPNIFDKNEIYFQSPDCFNDPFDSKISTTYLGTEEQRISSLKERWRKGPKKVEKEEDLHSQAVEVVRKGEDIPLLLRAGERSVERIRKRIGIFCMTSEPDNILMWSHYAEAHAGFCLEFNRANPFFSRAWPIEDEDYRPDRPCLNLIEPPDSKKTVEALFTKAIDWKYEHEWRIVDHENGPGVQIYPSDALSGVILGCRISPKNRQRITQWCKVRNPRPALYWAQEKDREFGLDIIPIC